MNTFGNIFGKLFGPPAFPRARTLEYDDYWKVRGFSLNAKLKEREAVMDAIIPPDARVFDIGCGNSLLPVVLKEKGCDVEVGDISDIVLAGFRERGIATSVIDLSRIAGWAPRGRYDCIIMSEVLEHMTNPEEIIARLAPHTGRFLLTVPNSAFYPFRLRLFFGGRFFVQWVYHPSEHVRFWSHTDFMDWLRAQGLILERAIPSNGLSFKGLLPFMKNIWPNLFGHQIVYVCRTTMELET